MAQVPQLPTEPLELLTNKGLIEPPYINKFWGPAIVGSLMFIGTCVSNWALRRPMLSGIQRHIVFTIAGGFFGKYVDDYRTDYLAERDAVLRDYIRLHCDDFPEIKRIKYAELFEPWYPIR
ncbi:hypothetical protein RI129_008012 [Pyrocoelia pectoralis]|uniref:NADH dehydrogenase [ubiquinone] 1 subunit C2 n=1 Tax=Pyrocoelia pectoralis TaxID=417401 RepID=A0AAN7ZIZ4_9COLE